MAEEQKEQQEKEPVVYTPEELQTIGELTTFFQKAPGQVDLPEGEEGAEGESGDALAAAAGGAALGAAAGAALSDASPPKRPVADLSKFDDVLNMDMDNLDAMPTSAETEMQDVPLDLPAEPQTADLGDLGDMGLPASEPLVNAAETGDFDGSTELTAGLPGIEESSPALPADEPLSLDDISTPADAAPADLGGDFNFDLPAETVAADAPAGDALDFGALDLPPATSEAPAADMGMADDFGLPAADTEFTPSAAEGMDLGPAPGDDFGLPAETAAEPSFDLPAEPVTDAPADLGGVFSFDAPPAADGADFGALDTAAPGLDDIAAPGEATPDMGDFASAPAAQDDSFNFDSSAPSLDDLSPEVALGAGAAAGALAGASLSSDLSSLAAEEASTVDPATLRRVRETLRSFPAPLRRRLSKALLDENMKPADSAELMRLLSEQASAQEIGAWLDHKNVSEVPEDAESGDGGPRIIMARPEYTDEGLARQEKIIKL
ncbi:MAG TPA: hypothetical protein PKG67_15050, partial [Turneriella sp.]|nr:hypothetical protein [Turneriella sp.]